MLPPVRYLVIVVYVITALLFASVTAHADGFHLPVRQMSVYDLIDAVNSLRLAYGLDPYSVNSVLMVTAQNQAEFMASTGQVTHSGPGGISLTQRLLEAGYPLAGDLSLGGFRAENITSGGEGMSAQAAIDGWLGDAPHQNTMLSPNLTEIGAGVAFANGRVYLVIDCARPTNASSAPSAGTAVAGGGTSLPGGDAPISPVILSTPNVKGEVMHEVKHGQTLWQLAISYGVKIDDIKRLNGLIDNSIYPGNKLLIKLEPTPMAMAPTLTAIPTLTATFTQPATTATPFSRASATLIPNVSTMQNPTTVMTWAIAIIALAIVGAGAFAWLAQKTTRSRMDEHHRKRITMISFLPVLT